MWTILLSFLMRASRKVLSTHLMHLDMGALYRKINGRETDRTKFGFLPLMAVSTNAQIGALNTESFAERIISVSNTVMNESSMHNDDDLEACCFAHESRVHASHEGPLIR